MCSSTSFASSVLGMNIVNVSTSLGGLMKPLTVSTAAAADILNPTANARNVRIEVVAKRLNRDGFGLVGSDMVLVDEYLIRLRSGSDMRCLKDNECDAIDLRVCA
ncbi:hypothetical protein MRB53_042293 [Persea americana]|nr:hypothetical protein MRB53_042293 [Persea americana]